MCKAVLTPAEFEEIIHFASRIARPVKDIRSNILLELSRIFGYDETIFWHADDHGNITDPAIYRLSERILFDYLNEYRDYEILHPKKYLPLFREKSVIRVADLFTMDQYEKSRFYLSFMKPYGFYDEVGIALTHEGKLIGLIGIAKKNYQKNFTRVDCKRLHYLSNIIASVFVHQFKDEMDYSMLSKREEEVVKLLKQGMTNQAIADELHISINTIKKHLQNIYTKHAVQNRTQLIQKLKN